MAMEALAEYEHKGYVFKRCKNTFESYDCLVIMRKPKNFKCNELREGVIDKNFAKFRCNGLITVAIYNLKFKKFNSSLYHVLDKRINFLYATYEVGILTEPDQYEEDVSKICASGIHYFLSLEAALSYKNGRVKCIKDKKIYSYDENGNLMPIKPCT
jgi:hypothetical protein